MDLRPIEALLEKYYDGATTVEEEKQLSTFFNSNEVPDYWKAEQIEFRFFTGAGEEKLRPEFDADLEQHLLAISPKSKQKSFTPLRVAAGIAAGLIIAMGLGLLWSPKQNNDTVSRSAPDKNAQIAYAQAKQALMKISNNLNKGNKEVARISKLNDIESLITNKK